ncbi:tyrosine-type recombinase/integrase [Paenibacillus ferrarius]|uniref:tyrosine-type recombinase/integrase n=1 Tax=Paenibacillus ferrarius TaxID=1469647 RepID=UPI003D26B757
MPDKVHTWRKRTRHCFGFEDPQIRNAIADFFDNESSYADFDMSHANNIVDQLPHDLTTSSISWSWFQNLFNSNTEKSVRLVICIFISMLIKHNCYNGDYKEILETFTWMKSGDIKADLYWLFSNSLLPFNLIVVSREIKKSNGTVQKSVSSFKTDCLNPFLSNLLREFIIKGKSTNFTSREFYVFFQASLNGKLITSPSDFNANTFKQQYDFYKRKFDDSRKMITFLKLFYLKLMNDGYEIMTWLDGIDRNMLQMISFNSNYERGFLPVPLNPFDSVPEFDRWLVMPNGTEKKSTKLKSFIYIPVDFSSAKDAKLRFSLKHWFWNSNVSLSARIDLANIIIKFVNFVYELRHTFSLRKITSPDFPFDYITVEEIFSYVSFVKERRLNIAYIGTVKRYLTYLQENNLYSVDPAVYKYLVTRANTHINTAKDIPDEDLIKIEASMKIKSAENELQTLYYILFHIAIATEFRISQITNLKIDCLGPKRDYYLESNSKVSNGEKIKIPITPYTKRYIETAINFTKEVRNSCSDDSIKEYIFIHNLYSQQFKIVTVRSFSDYLKRICLEEGIPVYTAQNLRDTYMTKSIEYAMKNNMSLLETKILTSHKQVDTTSNHYVADKIKEYLEATHMVVVGNLNIKGTVTTECDHTDEDLVNDECGFCKHQSCIKNDILDCLMCSGFIATIDRIPYFEDKILKINTHIEKAKLPHEKEEFLAIKRLYLAYLAKLLELKETQYECNG